MPGDTPYYLAAQVHKLDRLAIEEYGIAGFTLMQRAGQATFDALCRKWPNTGHALCFCGSGNNGGDGYVIAALARQQGLQATVVAVGSTDKLADDARLAFEMARSAEITVTPFTAFDTDTLRAEPAMETVIVDAMLGTGLTGAVRGDTLAAINLINAAALSVCAVDIPSGLCSDTGAVLGAAVHADMTVTFIGRKLGQVISEGPAACGELVFDDLAVPAAVYEQVHPVSPGPD